LGKIDGVRTVKANAIRKEVVVEREGLIPPPARSASGYRLYDAREIDRIRFIRKAQALGLRFTRSSTCSRSPRVAPVRAAACKTRLPRRWRTWTVGSLSSRVSAMSWRD